MYFSLVVKAKFLSSLAVIQNTQFEELLSRGPQNPGFITLYFVLKELKKFTLY